MAANLLNYGLLAQAQVTTEVVHWYQTGYGIMLILAAVIVVPFLLGKLIADYLRMPDYAWKIWLVLFTITASGVFIALGEFKLGIDLDGGTILVYELDKSKQQELAAGEQGESKEELMKKLVAAISQRIDPAGVKQVTIRKYGEEQVEIIIPQVNADEVEQIKRTISTAGNLEFRILADSDVEPKLVQRAQETPGSEVRTPPEPARFSNTAHAYLIGEARKATGDFVDGGPAGTARWVDIPADQLVEVKNDRDFVTRLTGEEVRQQLIIDGKLRAQWVEVGTAEPDGQPRVRPSEGSVQRPRGDGGQEMLVEIDTYNVTGDLLRSARTDYRQGEICVAFTFNSEGTRKFGTFTRENIPTTGRKRRLGILLDGQLLSAPTLQSAISDSGQITGNFTQEEVEWLVGVLNAGRLPAALNKDPISEQQIDPLLGQATIEAGQRAILISLVAVLVFLPIYYRFSGLVACFALLMNLLLVLGVMILIGAAFTLPGLAGLVLTVGMAVDANVLIFERIREEQERGAALRMAIRNGFGRATRTIVDANITTLITAVVLYVIGTDQIKGFAVTLILGILMSMFTAIFCTRVIFDIFEKKRWITQLSMARLLGSTSIDFLRQRYVAAIGSLALIGLGMLAVYAGGKELLDIDFRGGSKVEVVFKEVQDESEIEEQLVSYSAQQPKEKQLDSLKVVGVGEEDDKLKYNVESTADLSLLEESIKKVFAGKLKTNKLEYGSFQRIADEPATDTPKTAPDTQPEANTPEIPLPEKSQPEPEGAPSGEDEQEPAPDAPKEESDPGADQPGANDGSSNQQPLTQLLAQADTGAPAEVGEDTATDASDTADPPEAGEETQPAGESADAPGADTAADDPNAAQTEPEDKTPAEQPAAQPEEDSPPAAPAVEEDPPIGEVQPAQPADVPAVPGGPAPPLGLGGAEQPPKKNPFVGGTELLLNFADPLSEETLRLRLVDLIKAEDIGTPNIRITNPDVVAGSAVRQQSWKLETTLPVDQTESLLQKFQAQLVDDPIFPSATNVGSQVAGDTRNTAIYALVAALVCIIAYIWIRFQRVMYGLAAVVALVHDVLITLGVIALARYISDVPVLAVPLQMEEPFKISLPILAAFLTIIGYSLNDTIVVFDRIREVRGKSPQLTSEIINTSINQTLGRTLLTSLTTLIVVAILYFLGGAGIHGFAFALVVGVIVGTYSSIFVASPALLWMSRFGTGAVSDAKVAAERGRASLAG